MNEGRIVLCVFGVAALFMIAVPIGMLVTASSAPSGDPMKAAVSQFFLAAQKDAPAAQRRRTLPGITALLTHDMPDDAVFTALAASGFTCVPDSHSASCFRTVSLSSGCGAHWRVSVTFDAAGKLLTSEADSRTTCS